MIEVLPNELRLPPSPIPRPGERVVWHVASALMQGEVLGHDKSGNAVIKNDFGPEQHERFDDVRLESPFNRALPNWHSLPEGGRLLKPGEAQLELFRQTLKQVIAPGPMYIELAEEIWGRGFEIFLVGGTVRDVLSGRVANDIDFVTTMPLNRMIGFLKRMFRTDADGYDKRGYIRLGGKPSSGDPFIDLKVFSDALPGTKDATFGVGFDRDVAFRDFACNAVYFDPINEVIIDPTGHGVRDCESLTLRLVNGRHDRHQKAQVLIRAVKFVARGFEVTEETRGRLVEEYLPSVPAMPTEQRKQYFRTQVMSKHKTSEAKMTAVGDFKTSLGRLFEPGDWDKYFGFRDEDLGDA